ncbi:MAG: PTS sugar transporter subunit IIA [Candidatus Kaistia colombiensis]|nr:MAG: PTS sugar transporter subunit IIA [Kaistia sp.]
MILSEFIKPESVMIDLPAGSKTKLLASLSEQAALALGLPVEDIFQAIHNREKLGSTGVGDGIAIPHAPVPGLDVPFGMVARLKKPVDFESVDDIPVDIVCLLLMPGQSSSTYLNVLACMARKLRSSKVVKSIRQAVLPEQVYAALCEEVA